MNSIHGRRPAQIGTSPDPWPSPRRRRILEEFPPAATTSPPRLQALALGPRHLVLQPPPQHRP